MLLHLKRRLGKVMKIIALLVLAAVCLWMQPWADATARPQFGRSDAGRFNENSGRCPSGYHKSSITGRCVRNQFRLPTWNW